MKTKTIVQTKTYRLCAIGLAISALTIATAVLPVQAQPKIQQKDQAKTPTKDPAKTQAKGPAKIQTKEQTKTGMAGPGKLVPADLTFAGHGCTVLVPGDYYLSEFMPPAGKLFCFRGPEHQDKKTAVLNVTIMPSPKGADMPGERAIMDIMLNPQRNNLKKYKEEKLPIFTNSGHGFKGASFTGITPEGKESHGFVYVTQDKDTFFVLFSQDEAPFSDHSLPLLLKTARGCQIKKL